MKLLVFLVIGIAVCQAAELIEKKCADEMKLEEEAVIMISRQHDTPEDNQVYGKYYLCVWKGRGILNEKDAIVKEKVEAFLGEIFFYPWLAKEKREDIVSKVDKLCLSIHETITEKTALKLKNCIIGIIQESKILPPPPPPESPPKA